MRRRSLFLLTVIAASVTSCTLTPTLPANEQHFLDAVRNAGITGGTDQQVVTLGESICHLLGTGITEGQLVQAGETIKGLTETDEIVMETEAAIYLCPKYKHEFPIG